MFITAERLQIGDTVHVDSRDRQVHASHRRTVSDGPVIDLHFADGHSATFAAETKIQVVQFRAATDAEFEGL